MKTVVLCYPTLIPRYGLIRRGMLRFARQRTDWFVPYFLAARSLELGELSEVRVDGVIAFLDRRSELAAAKGIGVPMVNISAAFERQSFPRVRVDQRRDGQIAAEHFLQQGFSCFGYVGIAGHWGFRLRHEGFARRLRQAGHPCAFHALPGSLLRGGQWARETKELSLWLGRLSKPAAVYCCADPQAGLVLEVCRRDGLRVPSDVAVLGTDNETNICEETSPPLSSIAVNWEGLGYEAARRLASLLDGERAGDGDWLVPSLGVVQRRSTDLLAVASRPLRDICEHVENHLGEIRSMAEVAACWHLSRRTLERMFRRGLGLSPRQYLDELRLRRAMNLLRQDSREGSLKEICYKSGFTDRQQMHHLFKTRFGETPGQVRASFDHANLTQRTSSPENCALPLPARKGGTRKRREKRS
ncbi:MAG: DNA-binding transcriptional regulator [Kiritimatiellae bacterium]|nr:DNA-binding transcriptional regulator [Kiritimatiellia bacterium]